MNAKTTPAMLIPLTAPEMTNGTAPTEPLTPEYDPPPILSVQKGRRAGAGSYGFWGCF